MMGGGGKDPQAQRSRHAKVHLLCQANPPPAPPMTVPGKPMFTKAVLTGLVLGEAAVLRSSVVCSPGPTVGRDAVKKLGSLMNLRIARSQNNISQVPVLKFQEYCGHNCCKELWDWSGIQRVSTGSRLIEHGVPGYMRDGLPTRVLLNLYS